MRIKQAPSSTTLDDARRVRTDGHRFDRVAAAAAADAVDDKGEKRQEQQIEQQSALARVNTLLARLPRLPRFRAPKRAAVAARRIGVVAKDRRPCRVLANVFEFQFVFETGRTINNRRRRR